MKGKILIVDDEESMRRLLSQLFFAEGYEVAAAENGPSALEILRHSVIDVIFLDLKLFSMDGIELCRKIRETQPVSMIFAVTGWSPLFGIEECRGAGFDDYFEKPLDMKLILASVEDAFGKLNRWKRLYSNPSTP